MKMKTFVLKFVLFLFLISLSIFLPAFISSKIVKNRHFKNNETESNLLVMNNNEKFDLIIAGISHARNFSRYKNHLIVEKILNKKILNIGQGGGACSANEQNFYLSYFYDNGNSANTLLYVLSPPLLYSETLSKASNTFELEPFQFRFFLSYLFYNSENKYQRLFYYIKSKFQKNWINYMPESIADKTEKLVSLDTTEVNMGFKLAYPKGLDSSVFNYNVSVVENTIKLALKNNN